MKYLILILAVALTGCAATMPELTAVVNAPVRVSCATSVPPMPPLLTPCPKDGDFETCFVDYQADNRALLGHVENLTGIIKACQ